MGSRATLLFLNEVGISFLKKSFLIPKEANMSPVL